MLPYQLLHSPTLRIFFGAFLISFSGIFVKLADVSPTASGFYRVFFGAIFLFCVCGWSKDYKKIQPALLWYIILCGFTFALDLYFWHQSILYIGPGLATLLGNFQVFLLAGVGIIFLGEKGRPRLFAAIPLAIIGLLMIVGVNWNEMEKDYLTGINFGLLTAVCYTAFLLLLRRIQADDEKSTFFSLMIVSISCSAFLGAKILYSGESFVIPDVQSLTALLGLGLFSQTLGWVLIANALPQVPTSRAGLILLLQPALSFIWDVLFFNRPTELFNWVGVLITLTAIYMGLTGKIRQKI
jgi:drug/metabolite transporter (DMT)-like permease